MASLVQHGKYGSTNTTEPTKLRYYVLKYVSETYNLQEDTTCDGKISMAGELVVKAKCMRCIIRK